MKHVRRQILITSLATLVTVTMPALTGCRIGNRVSKSESSSDTLSGYYGTAPQSLKFCATTQAEHCVDSPTNRVPSLISAQMSDPVALIMQDLNTGDAYLTAYNGGGRSALPVWLGMDNTTLYFVSGFTPQGLWKDTQCISRMYLEEEGFIVPGEALPVPGSSRKTLGRITLKVRITEVFEDNTVGSCKTTLEAMDRCYQDVSQCGGVDAASNQAYQEVVRTLFDPYIQTGAMSAADISEATHLAYEIQYQ